MEMLALNKERYQLVEIFYFTHNGINILLDVNHSDFYEVDDIHLDVLKWIENKEDSEKNILEKYGMEEVDSVITELLDCGILKEEQPEYEKITLDRNKEVVNLVMNISQDCNLRCRYCFASTGHYKGERALMSEETAEQTLLWFVNQAETSKALNLHLFGGEPLMNVPLVRYIVALCKELENTCDKKIYINICTNGTILDDELLALMKDNQIGLQISIDGPKDIHDKYRPTADNGSSYDLIVKNLDRLFSELDKNTIIPRSTISRGITDVNYVVNHLLEDLQFNSVFFIPAMGCGGTSYDTEDMPELFVEYDKLIETFLDKLRVGEEYNIFPFISEIDAVGKGIRRIYGCGAGIGFASVDIKGDIYPCMRFTNNSDFKIGDIKEGFNCNRDKLFDRTVYKREVCKTCWSRHLCGGACIAIPVENGETERGNNQVTCEMSKHLAKLAMYANTVIAREGLNFNKNQLKVNDFMRRRFQ